ncbi:hypothetical protein B0H17DRAFT_230599 [Mycena rosella]|uniref:Uncharacterized protein n=1 Tax=Mycena rosella TaxID=1033263 RepID=A0AAD7H0N6_MYCRO|nr:hypothetical protein B0H17DRAFT_230599 [Mycena rosella]
MGRQFLGCHASLSKFYPLAAAEYKKSLQCLLESTERFLYAGVASPCWCSLRRNISVFERRAPLSCTSRMDTLSMHDTIVALVDSVMEEVSAAIVPGALFDLIKYVPAWTPGAGFQRKIEAWSHHLPEMIETTAARQRPAGCFVLLVIFRPSDIPVLRRRREAHMTRSFRCYSRKFSRRRKSSGRRRGIYGGGTDNLSVPNPFSS